MEPKYLELAKCSDCPLQGSKKVLGEGSKDLVVVRKGIRHLENYGFSAEFIEKDLDRKFGETYPLAFVGISPAENEVLDNRPFTGWSGKVLRGVLGKLKVKDFYFTNSFLCFYPEEGDEELSKAQIVRQATRCCSERLQAELDLVSPKLVVALGNVALETLTGKDYKVSLVNGRILPGTNSRFVLPVLHPAGLKRRPDEFFEMVDALKSAPRWVKSTYQQIGIPNTVVIKSEEELLEVCNLIHNSRVIAVDTETTKRGLFPYGRDPDTIRCVIVSCDGETSYIIPGNSSPYYEPHIDLHQHPSLIEAISEANLDTHNGPFDVGFFLQAGYSPKIGFDSFLGHYTLDEREYSHGLKPLGHKYLGAPDWEAGLKDYLPHKNSSYDLIPDEALYTYAGWDGVVTYQLCEGVNGRGGFKDRLKNHYIFNNLLIPCANMFSQIRHRGFPIDVTALANLDEELEEDYDQSVKELQELVGYQANPLSAPEMIELIYDKLEYPVNPRIGRSSAKSVLKTLGGPIPDKILECRATAKLKGTYVLGVANFVDRSFRIHPFTKLHGAVTGRISTEDPSVMNVTPRGGVKRIYLPEKGGFIVEADAKAMELVCYSIVQGDEHLKELLIKSRTDKRFDPHGMIARKASELIGREIPRQRAKTGVFGKLYGESTESFTYRYGLARDEAFKLEAAIFGMFPSMPEYNNQVIREIHEQGYLESYFGRRRRFGLLLDENKNECYRQGANFKIQSMASDINLFCMLHLWEMRDKFNVLPMFPVHDSIVMSILDEEVIGPIVRELESFAGDLVQNKMTFKYEVKAGKNWADTCPFCEACNKISVYRYTDEKGKKHYECPKCRKEYD